MLKSVTVVTPKEHSLLPQVNFNMYLKSSFMHALMHIHTFVFLLCSPVILKHPVAFDLISIIIFTFNCNCLVSLEKQIKYSSGGFSSHVAVSLYH